MNEFTKNLPHLIAISLLIVAVLEVLILSGLMRCSTLGKSYCDFHYMIAGYPQVAIITDRDGAGIGDYSTMKRMLERDYRIPVTVIDVDLVREGALHGYDVVLVEQARKIPTSTLQVIKDYVSNDMGKLVWVGDAGALGDNMDKMCRDAKYTVEAICPDLSGEPVERKYAKVKEELKYEICATMRIKANESVSEGIDQLVQDWYEKAEAQAIKFRNIYADPNEYGCRDVQVNWTNSRDFSSNINPWVRGKYERIGEEYEFKGIDFSSEVLGVNYFSDAFAVNQYKYYAGNMSEMQQYMQKANEGFTKCERYLRDKCPAEYYDPSSLSAKIVDAADDMQTHVSEFANYLNTWNSMALEPASPGSAPELEDYGIIEAIEQAITALQPHGGDASVSAVISSLERKREEIEGLYAGFAGKSNSDAGARSQIFGQISTKADEILYDKNLIVSYAIQYETASGVAQCEAGDAASNIAKQRNLDRAKVRRLESYANEWSEEERMVAFMKEIPSEDETRYLRDEAGRIEKMANSPKSTFSEAERDNYLAQARAYKEQAAQMEIDVAEWNAIWAWMSSVNLDEVMVACDEEDDVIVNGFRAAADGIAKAQEIKSYGEEDMVTDETHVATFMPTDVDHPLISGYNVFDLVEKGKFDEIERPAPFVLATSKPSTYVVAQMEITPGYPGKEGYRQWAAITAYNPSFGTHIFGMGTTIYYAFPPEFSPHFVNNLVDFMLY